MNIVSLIIGGLTKLILKFKFTSGPMRRAGESRTKAVWVLTFRKAAESLDDDKLNRFITGIKVDKLCDIPELQPFFKASGMSAQDMLDVLEGEKCLREHRKKQV